MKRLNLFFILLLMGMALFACAKNPEASHNASNTQIKPTISPNANRLVQPPNVANQNSASPPNSEAAANSATAPTVILQGTYVINEVQHDGIVETISDENTVAITFKPPASFSRVSKKKGKVDYTDSGQYKINGDKQLILKILMSKEQFQLKPVEKKFGFVLSPDGTEMKLITTKENKERIAVFRRVKP
ncbi:MAG: hypothetical protein HY231_14955 [Acidobacteria bacterium]|nr:hypothetical protein [Acidobacteriota bacterium]